MGSLERSVGPPWPGRSSRRPPDALLDPGPRAPGAAELGLPLEPELAVRLNGAMEAGRWCRSGLGLYPRLAAGALAHSLVQTTLAVHPYWRLADSAIKNVGLFGGALLVLAERPTRRR